MLNERKMLLQIRQEKYVVNINLHTKIQGANLFRIAKDTVTPKHSYIEISVVNRSIWNKLWFKVHKYS